MPQVIIIIKLGILALPLLLGMFILFREEKVSLWSLIAVTFFFNVFFWMGVVFFS